MKKLLLSFLCLLSASIGFSYAQSIYETRDSIKCGDIEYLFDRTPSRVVVENAGNTLLHQYIYKVGSNPREYYTNATGWTGFAEMDEAVLADIGPCVFCDQNWAYYADNPGFIDVTMAVNPSNGKVLEVEFCLYRQGSDRILEVPIEKLYIIEQMLKESAECHVSQEIKDAMPSYVRSGFCIFHKMGFGWL